MTEVFISYSRRDKEFVRRLHEALLAQKRDVWVDWEDIPPTADWRAEIRGGIEATNAMVFVISPDSVRSKECRVELELALENNKRFIPLMYRMVTDPADQQGMHPSLNSHNWIYLRDEDPFDQGFQTLVKALDTDLAYVREHTRLLVRAREWDAEKRDGSLLLRGSDLIEAESWLAGALEAKPPPTQLHSDYIRTSRQAETARGRRLLAGVMVALLVSLVLGVFAFVQWQQSATNLALANTRGTEVAQQAATSDANALLAQNNAATADANAILAQNNEATAVYNEGRTRSIALAAQAQLDVGNKNPERGALLAFEALKNYPYTSQAEYALGLAVQSIVPNRIFPGAASYEANAYWSPDGQRLAVVSDSNNIDIWDINSGERVTTLDDPDYLMFRADWSPDGTRIATSADDGMSTVWGANWQPQFRLEGIGALWSPDGRQIVTYGARFFVWDTGTGELLYAEGSPESFFNLYQPMAWSPDGMRLAIGDASGTISILDAADGTKQVEWAGHDDTITVINWSPDGSRLVTGSGNLNDVDASADASALVWDTVSGELVWTLSPDSATPIINAAWSPDATAILTSNFDGVDVFDAQTGDIKTGFSGFAPRWSPDSASILVGSTVSNQAAIHDAKSGQLIQAFSSHSAGIFAVAWSPDGTLVSTASLDGTVRAWVLNVTRAQFVLEDDYYFQPEWAADGRNLWINRYGDGSALLWDIESGTQLAESPINTLAIAPAGESRYLTANEADELTVVDANNQVISTFSGHSDLPSSVHWSPDGREIATADREDNLFVWDAQTGETRLELTGHFARWSPDGSRLLVIAYGADRDHHIVTIHDATTGALLSTLPLTPDANGLITVPDALWSPDGSRVATMTEQGIGTTEVIEIWDAATAERLYTLHGKQFSWSPDGTRIAIAQNDGTVTIQTLSGDLVYSIVDPNLLLYDVAWSPDGRYVATLDRYDSLKVWPVWPTTDALVSYAQACCLAREFTAAERQQFGLPATQ